jgi:hypothetical protein
LIDRNAQQIVSPANERRGDFQLAPLELAMEDASKKSTFETAASHFPFWTFACMAYAEHIGRDYQKHLMDLARTTAGLEAVQCESAYDMHLMSDLARAYYELALMPYAAVMASLVQSSDAPSLAIDEANPPAAPTRTRLGIAS